MAWWRRTRRSPSKASETMTTLKWLSSSLRPCEVLRTLRRGINMKLNCLGGNETWSFGGLVLGCIDAGVSSPKSPNCGRIWFLIKASSAGMWFGKLERSDVLVLTARAFETTRQKPIVQCMFHDGPCCYTQAERVPKVNVKAKGHLGRSRVKRLSKISNISKVAKLKSSFFPSASGCWRLLHETLLFLFLRDELETSSEGLLQNHGNYLWWTDTESIHGNVCSWCNAKSPFESILRENNAPRMGLL